MVIRARTREGKQLTLGWSRDRARSGQVCQDRYSADRGRQVSQLHHQRPQRPAARARPGQRAAIPRRAAVRRAGRPGRDRFHPLSLHAQQVPAQAARCRLRDDRGRNAAGDVDAAAADAGVQRAHPGSGSAPELRDCGHRQALARAVRSSGRERRRRRPSCTTRPSMRRVRGTMRATTCARGLVAKSRCDSPSMAKSAAWDSGAAHRLRPPARSRCAS